MRQFSLAFSTLFLPLLLARLTHAQTAKAPTAIGKTVITAGRTIYTSKGVRLESARGTTPRVQTPQLDVQAATITLDTANNTLTEARANGKVRIDVQFPPSNGQTSRVYATCNNATLQPAARTLTLTGSVNGYYQVGNGPKNTLRGDRAVLRQQADGQIGADVTGKSGVSLTVPAETLAPGQGSASGSLGPITITARQIVATNTNSVRFIGNARAVSTGGENAFDVRATEFVLSRASDGAIGTLTTMGRTHIVLDLPPDPAPAPSAATTSTDSATSPDTSATATKNNGLLGDVGRPTRVTADADGAVLTRENQTLTLSGNVTGTYRLAPPNAAASDYNFSGDRALLRYNPTPQGDALAGFSADVSGKDGKPVVFTAPALNFGF